MSPLLFKDLLNDYPSTSRKPLEDAVRRYQGHCEGMLQKPVNVTNARGEVNLVINMAKLKCNRNSWEKFSYILTINSALTVQFQ